MKIKVTLEVSDDARSCIAINMKNQGLPYLATQDGFATRATVIKFLQDVLKHAHASYEPVPKLDPLERAETEIAVAQLRAIGWADSRIKSWLLKNSALMQGARLTLWEEPLLVAQPAKVAEPAATA